MPGPLVFFTLAFGCGTPLYVENLEIYCLYFSAQNKRLQV